MMASDQPQTPAALNSRQISEALTLFHADGERFEVRILASTLDNRSHVLSRVYSNPDEAALDIVGWALRNGPDYSRYDIYHTLQKFRPLKAGVPTGLNKRGGLTRSSRSTKDTAIEAFKYLFVDIDPDPLNPPTVEDLSMISDEVDSFLGSEAAIRVYTGRGFHAYYKLDLASDLTTTRMIARMLTRINAVVGTTHFEIDSTMCNPSRITRVPFTVNSKTGKLVEVVDVTPDAPVIPQAIFESLAPEPDISETAIPGTPLEIDGPLRLLHSMLEPPMVQLLKMKPTQFTLTPDGKKASPTDANSPPGIQGLTEPGGAYCGVEFADWVISAHARKGPLPPNTPIGRVDAFCFVHGFLERDDVSRLNGHMQFKPDTKSEAIKEAIKKARLTIDGFDDALGDLEKESLSEEDFLRNKLLYTPWDDAGHAECTLLLFPNLFLHNKAWGWMSYSGTHWEATGAEVKVGLAIEDTLKQRRMIAAAEDDPKKTAAARSMNSRVGAVKGRLADRVYARTDLFDADHNLLNHPGGVTDLKTGNTEAHSPDQRFTYCIDTAYNPSASMTMWTDWLLEALTPEAVAQNGSADARTRYTDLLSYIQLAMGYSITGETAEQCLFYVWGRTRAGKGVFLQAIQKVLGSNIATGADFRTFAHNRRSDDQRFDLAPLKDAHLVLVAESERTLKLSAATVKQVTGNDLVTCSFKGKDHFSYVPRFKIWITSNFKVRGDAEDDALWGRLRVIHFPNTYLGREDKYLLNRLLQHREGILRWLVEGSIRWFSTKGGLYIPEMLQTESETHRLDNDTLGQFINEKCSTKEPEKGKPALYPVTQFRADYEWFCEEMGYTAMLGRRLNEYMERSDYTSNRKSIKNAKGEWRTVRCWLGVRVSDEANRLGPS